MTKNNHWPATASAIAFASAMTCGLAMARAADLTTVRFVYDWSHADFEMIPTVIAQSKGFYDAEGLKVDVILPPDSQTTARLLAVGQAEIGYEATTDVVFGASQGIPITSIGIYSQSNNWGLFGRPGEPVTLDKLKGKSIAIFTDSWTKAMMPFVLKAAHLNEDDVKLTKAYPDSGTIEYNKLGWKATVPLLKGPHGYMVQTDQHWLPLAQALKDTDQIKTVLPASKYYTNDILK